MKKLLVFVIIFLLIGMSATPLTGTIKEPGKSSIGRAILYVGGSGEGNYSKIQDAIDNVSIGATVFVYNDSSPYYENIYIDKWIKLIGESRETTIIDGGSGYTIYINIDSMPPYAQVVINGFTIRNY